MEAISNMPCPCCAQLGYYTHGKCHVHHLLRGGKRMGHWWTLNICPGHHIGQWAEWQLESLHKEELVSIASGRKVFEGSYGTEKAMWLQLQRANGWDDSWPTDKIVRRKAA
jgi:hypothetical protein